MSKSKTKAPAQAPAVAPPGHLDATATAKWRELWLIVAQRENIDQGTLDALAAYCLAYSRWTEAEGKITELGSVIKSPAGFAVPSPYLAVAKDAQRAMRQMGGRASEKVIMGFLGKSNGTTAQHDGDTYARKKEEARARNAKASKTERNISTGYPGPATDTGAASVRSRWNRS